MGKISKWHPTYKLAKTRMELKGVMPDATFNHQGILFSVKFPIFGVTETQKEALRWAWSQMTPPVVSIAHDKPVPHGGDVWHNPEDLHQTYFPYARVTATIQCLGEAHPRMIKIYFCHVIYHINNGNDNRHLESKGVRVAPL